MSGIHLIYDDMPNFQILGLRVPLGPPKRSLGSYFGLALFKNRFLAQFYPSSEDIKNLASRLHWVSIFSHLCNSRPDYLLLFAYLPLHFSKLFENVTALANFCVFMV